MLNESTNIDERTKMLLISYMAQALTPAEAEELEARCQEQPFVRLLLEDIDNQSIMQKSWHYSQTQDTEGELQIVLAQMNEMPSPANSFVIGKKRSLRWVFIPAAAILLVALGKVFLFPSSHRMAPEHPTVVYSMLSTIPPAALGPILTTGKGDQILLDTLSSDTKHLSFIKRAAYIDYFTLRTQQGQTSGNDTDSRYHTLKTPYGRTVRIILPDGSKVWLNNASTLRYPSIFKGDSLPVELTGEAYFETAKNANRYFAVLIRQKGMDDQRVGVLGTSFNISAYSDEKHIVTTLISGKVVVDQGGRRKILTPDQQLISKPDGSWDYRQQADPVKITAWKDGDFNFDGDSLYTALRKIARWYGRTVVVKDSIPSQFYRSIISRKKPLRNILETLAQKEHFFQFDIEKPDEIIISR